MVAPAVNSPCVSTSPAIDFVVKRSGHRTAISVTVSWTWIPSSPNCRPVSAKRRRQEQMQEPADFARFVGQFIEQIVAQLDLIRYVERDERLGGRRTENHLGRGRIAEHVELGRRRDVAPVPTPSRP